MVKVASPTATARLVCGMGFVCEVTLANGARFAYVVSFAGLMANPLSLVADM